MVTHLFKKSVLAAAMAASALAGASPAMANSYGNYRRHDDTGKIIAAAVAGVIVGAVLNSNRNSRNGRCVTDRNGNSRCYRANSNGAYNNGYNQGGYYQQGGYDENGGYYQNDGYGGRGRSYSEDRARHRDYDRREDDDDDDD